MANEELKNLSPYLKVHESSLSRDEGFSEDGLKEMVSMGASMFYLGV